jgi:hypothetical protein
MVARFESEAGKLEASAVLGRGSNGVPRGGTVADRGAETRSLWLRVVVVDPLRLFSAH